MTTTTDTKDMDAAGCARWEQLKQKIERVHGLLVNQGTLVTKKRDQRTYWALRYYELVGGKRKQRCIYIGDNESAQRVRGLLKAIRAPHEFFEETLTLAKLAVCIVRPLVRSGRRRTAAAEAADASGSAASTGKGDE
jgi:hypothetical protein